MNAIDTLNRQKYVLLETRKRDGSWVGTAVSIAADGERAYFRSYDAAGKAKRLRNFPEVRVTPSNFRGKPTGKALTGTATLLGADDARRAAGLLAAKYPILHRWLVPAAHRRKGWTTLHYELTLDPS
jgi:PPOX class probable F420-dependent enzyme